MSLETILYNVALAFIGPAVFCLSLLLLLLPYFASRPTDICITWLLIAVSPIIMRRIKARRQKRLVAEREQEREQEPAKATIR